MFRDVREWIVEDAVAVALRDAVDVIDVRLDESQRRLEMLAAQRESVRRIVRRGDDDEDLGARVLDQFAESVPVGDVAAIEIHVWNEDGLERTSGAVSIIARQPRAAGIGEEPRELSAKLGRVCGVGADAGRFSNRAAEAFAQPRRVEQVRVVERAGESGDDLRRHVRLWELGFHTARDLARCIRPVELFGHFECEERQHHGMPDPDRIEKDNVAGFVRLGREAITEIRSLGYG